MKKHGKNSQPCILLILPAQNSFPFEIGTFTKKNLFHTSANIRINTFLWKQKTRAKSKLLHIFCAFLFFSQNRQSTLRARNNVIFVAEAVLKMNINSTQKQEMKSKTNCSATSSRAKYFAKYKHVDRMHASALELSCNAK